MLIDAAKVIIAMKLEMIMTMITTIMVFAVLDIVKGIVVVKLPGTVHF